MIASPYAASLGLTVEEQEGGFTLLMPFDDTLSGRPGFLHGGVIAGLLEVAGIEAVRRALAGEAASIKPVTVTVDFLRGGRPEPTRATATVTRLGGRIANVEARAWQDDPARPIGTARLNLAIRRETPPPPRAKG